VQLTPPRVGQPDIVTGHEATPPGFTDPPLVAVVLSPQSRVQLTPTWVGQSDVEPGDETPTPREAARRLARFLDEVRVVREPPLIASPPRQRAIAKWPLSVRRRSTRIVAQPLAHIPASQWGEVLLKQRLGIAPPAAMTRCFWRSTGVHASSSWRTRRARRCSHVGCSIYVISNRRAVC
jgi:hypothetical protein